MDIIHLISAMKSGCQVNGFYLIKVTTSLPYLVFFEDLYLYSLHIPKDTISFVHLDLYIALK